MDQTNSRYYHYYGDTLRQIYLAMAIIVIIATPFFYDRFPLSGLYSVLGVVILALFAGLTSPKNRIIIIADFVVALGTLLAFGYGAVNAYKGTSADAFLWCNIILAILSVFAVYLSSKTLRGELLS